MSKIGEYKKHENELPYSVKDSMKGSTLAYNNMIEMRSFDKRIAARQRTIDAWTTVQKNHSDFKAGTWTPPVSVQEQLIQETSMFSKIYNWFLSINY